MADKEERRVADQPEAPVVLVADDDGSIRALYVRALTRAGLDVVEAADGIEALEVLARTPVSLILLDHSMPRMTGREVVERVRADERTATIPIILVTGSSAGSDPVLALEAGADDYVSKTTSIQELVARVRARLRTKVAWADVLSRELDQRARTVAALGSLPAAETPEEAARAILEQLAERHGTSFVGLLARGPSDDLTPLAEWSASRGLVVGGAPISRSVAKFLMERTASGPWMGPVVAPLQAGGLFSGDEVGFTAVAPLKVGEHLVGLLSLGIPPGRTAVNTPDLLAATIDYAGVASAILGPGLEALGREETARRKVERVLTTHAFHPVFQPVVDLATWQTIGFEALTRFTDGTAPDLRFAEAIRLGIGRAFEATVIAEILRVATPLPPDAWLGINVSPLHVLEPEWLRGVLGEPSRPVVIELTEHAQIDEYGPLRETLDAVRSDRIQVAVDDAGAGYASLRHILELRPSYVKLDMTLVRGVQDDPVRQALIAGLSFFATRTGSRLIAEGIETEDEAAAVRVLGITLGQGYLLGQPAPVEDWS
jgi:EAL domain-containing protein (putative c-di-GMP-specific phosphodiesterase class I)/DNA-binding response OmpR family regulator